MNHDKRASRRYKKISIVQEKVKHNERQHKYSQSRKNAWEKDQKQFCRSRQAKFQNVTATDAEIKENRQKLRIRKHRSRALQREHESYDQNEIKRKAAFLRWSKCVEIYEDEIRQLYSHVCNSCGKLCKKNQVRSLKVSTLKEKGHKQRFINKIFYIKKSESEVFCKTCISYIQKGNIPKMCLYNGLEFPEVDNKINQLNRIEERLLAPRHVFQTLWTMNGGSGQYRTKGGIVNVPVDMDTTVSCIPRALSDSNMIHVKLARRMQYVSNYMVGNVRPKLLYDAARKFVKKPLPMEEGIELSTDWNFTSSDDDLHNFEDEFYTNNAIFETLLTTDNLDFMSASNFGIRMAPAEDYTPTSILFDENCEFLAFPKVFGGHKMEPEYKHKKISYADFAKSLILRHDRRAIQKTWKSPEGPFLHHKISHYYHRIEFQQRGSPHVHMLLWLEGAPKFDINDSTSKDNVCTFIDKIISCSSETLSEDLVKLQTHRHSHTCKKKHGNADECRFGIPYFPIKSTTILAPLPDDMDPEIISKYKQKLQKIKRQLDDKDTVHLSFEEIIRFRNYHYEIDPDNFLREQITLYVPWRNETSDILEQDLEALFTRNKKQILNIRHKFSAFDDKALLSALEHAEERFQNEDDSEDHPTRPHFDFDDFSLKDKYNTADIQLEFDEDYTSNVSFTSPTTLPDIEYQELFTKLNQEQRDYVMHVCDTIEKTDEQMLHFLTGGAGVGKSLFEVYELTRIMRQSNMKFQTALNNLAKGRLSKEDIKLFTSRCFKKVPKNEDMTEAFHLFARNDDVDEYNNKIMRQIKGKSITCEASDIIRGNGSHEKTKKLQIMYHNIQSLIKHVHLVRNDTNFMTSDVLLFGETWSPKTENISLKHFKQVAKTDCGHIRKPKGLSLYVRKSILNKVKKSEAFTLSDAKKSIDIGIIELSKMAIIALYASPNVSTALWIKFFKFIKSELTKQCIIVGDFNINSMKLRPNNFMMKMITKLNLRLLNKKTVTTHHNTGIDWIVANTNLHYGTYNSFFSHHYPIWMRKACKINTEP
ncbi:Envelope glycoprotein M [Frankliniella fusca]|uniref:Envelope glycoprotein M n=1 Tax=Frankliniella fusca TaxID=407009 RepID=A0AAE1LKL3_9NEOP|nr:Envelope glycoprotein M [Frankliniella fusca]